MYDANVLDCRPTFSCMFKTALTAQPSVAQDPAPTAASAPALQSQTDGSQSGGIGAMRRSVGMRDSMCFFLQLEGAVEGHNGFEPEEVLKACCYSTN